MSRSVDVVHREMLSLVPPGWVWPRNQDSLFASLLRPTATVISEIEASAEAMMDEVDPRTAVECLPDFERVLGPDPCGRDLLTMSIPERQDLAHQRWTARGGQSIAYFTGLAAKRGVTIAIEEVHPSCCGVAVCGDELIRTPEQFVWRILLDATDVIIAEAGKSTAGDLLVEYKLSDVECDIRRAKPAHTELLFSYITEDA